MKHEASERFIFCALKHSSGCELAVGLQGEHVQVLIRSPGLRSHIPSLVYHLAQTGVTVRG